MWLYYTMTLLKPSIDKLVNESNTKLYKWLKKNNIPEQSPYCVQWKNDKKMLNYIGTIHSYNTNNATCNLMKKIIDQYTPEIVIIEGIHEKKGINPEIPKRLINTEMEYLVMLCRKNKINYVGIETADETIYDMLKNKYNIEDIYGYLFLMHNRWNYKRKKSEKDFLNDFYDRTLKHYQTYVKKINWNHDEWFLKTYKKTYKYSKYIKYSEPIKNNKNNIAQQISFDWHRARDICNIQKLYYYLNKYNNIVYSMGRNHVFIDRKVISNTIGKYKSIII